MSAHGHFHWNELVTNDVESAKTFYADAIGWAFEAMPMPQGGTYWVARMGDTPVGGLFLMSGPALAGEHWIPYLAVDDVDARLQKAVAAGAQVLKPAHDIPGVGRMAILRQPGGAALGWITPAA
jgi:predicted enzyme related to lactoylglutathione lyase